MTTDSVVMRSSIITMIGEWMHGQDGRSHTQAGTRRAIDAVGQDARRGRACSRCGTADRVHLEGATGRRRPGRFACHEPRAASEAGRQATRCAAHGVAARRHGPRLRHRAVDAQARARAHRAAVRRALQPSARLAAARRHGLQLAKARAPGHRARRDCGLEVEAQDLAGTKKTLPPSTE